MITVAVFSHVGKRKVLYTAYTRWFSQDWHGCCIHKVDAVNGTQAKKLAIQEHKAKCGTH